MILRCPDTECYTTYDASDDPDTAFELMVNHFRYNMRHNGRRTDNRTIEDAMLVVSEFNAGAR